MPEHLFFNRSDVGEETAHLFRVELIVRAQAAADVQTERLHLRDGVSDSLGIQATDSGPVTWMTCTSRCPATPPAVFRGGRAQPNRKTEWYWCGIVVVAR